MDRKQLAIKYRFLQEAGSSTYKLFLYDNIRAQGRFNWNTWDYEESETSAKYFRDQLDKIPSGAEIHLHVNSAGGEVSEGVTIYNLLKQKAQTGCRIIGYVDGTAYSVAMVIVMACSEIHMGLGTTMLMHYPWMYAEGNAEELRQYADQLDALSDASVKLYMSKAKGVTEDELREMLKKETMLAPDQCKEYGFCDVIDDYKAEVLPAGDPGKEPGEPEGNPLEEARKQIQALTERVQRQEKEMAELRSKGRKPEMAETFTKALELLKK